MKKIFLSALLFLCGIAGYSQAVVLVRGDTIKIYKQGAVSNLVVEGKIINRYMPASDTPSYVVGVTPSGQFQKINKGTLGGGAGNPNSNVGTGYRWAIPHTNNIKTFFVGYGLGVDSAAHANALTLTVDTTAISTRAYVDSKSFTGNPAGNNTELQFNNSGVFGASSNLVYNGTQFKIGVNNTVFDVATGYISRYANVPPGSGNLLIGDGADSKMKFGTITSPNGSIGIGYNSPNIQIQLDTSLHHTVGYYDMRYGVGGEGANNYTTSSSFTNNTLTMQRNGLGDLTASFDTTRWHTKLYYDGIYGNGGANNYSTATSFTDNVLTTQRNGLGDLTASFDTTKWHTLGYYDGRYGNGSGTNNGNSGSGHRLLYNGTQDLRTLYGGYAMSWDTTTNATGVTVKIDTTQMATRAYANGYGGAGGAPTRGDSTINVVGTNVSFRDYVNVKTKGAKGNGSDNDKTAFQDAAAEAVAEGKPLFMPPGQYKITGGLDLGGATIVPAPGAYFKGNTGSAADSIENFTLDADVQQKVFDTTITVHKMKPSSGVFSVMNFGAVADCLNTAETGTTDNYNAFRRTLMAMYDDLPTGNGYYYSRTLYVPAGKGTRTYYISHTLYLGGNISIVGDGMHNTVLNWPRGVPGIVLTNTSYGNTAQYANPQGQAAKRIGISNIALSGYKGQEGYFPGFYDGVSHGLTFYSGEGKIENVHVMGWQGDGVRVYGANNVRFDNVVSEYNTGNGFHFMTADGNASVLIAPMARWNGRNGFYDPSFLGNFVFAPNAEANGGHNLFTQSAVTHGGKFFYCKKDVVWRVTHNGHHYTCIQAHESSTSTEPGTGGGAAYWTDNGAANYWSIKWPNWEDFQTYVTGAIEPEVTTGWQDYFEQTIDFEWANIAWNDTTSWYAGAPYDIEGANQTGVWVGLYTEFDQIAGHNNSNSYVAFGNGGTVIKGWSQKLQGGNSIFQHVVVQNPDNTRWWAMMKGKGLDATDLTANGFGWYNSGTGDGRWIVYDSLANYVKLQNINGFDIPYLRTLYNIENTGTYLGQNKMRLFNIGRNFSKTTPGLLVGQFHIDPYNSNDSAMAFTFGAASNLQTAQAGFYVFQNGASGTSVGIGNTNNYATGSQMRFFIYENGQIQFNTYGSGTHSGTATKWAAFSADGKIIEVNPPPGGGASALTIQSPLTGGSYDGSAPVTIGLDTASGKWRSEGYYDTKYAPIGGGGGSLTQNYIGYGSVSNVLTGTADIQREAEAALTLKHSSGTAFLKLNSSVSNNGGWLQGIDTSLMIWTNGVRRIWVQGERGVWISRHNPQTMSYTGTDYDLQIGEKALIPELVIPTSIVNSGTYLQTGKMTLQGNSSDWNETTPGLTTGSLHMKPSSASNNGSSITFGGQGHLDEAEGGIFYRPNLRMKPDYHLCQWRLPK